MIADNTAAVQVAPYAAFLVLTLTEIVLFGGDLNSSVGSASFSLQPSPSKYILYKDAFCFSSLGPPRVNDPSENNLGYYNIYFEETEIGLVNLSHFQ